MEKVFVPYVSITATNSRVPVSGSDGNNVVIKLESSTCKCEFEGCKEKPAQLISAHLSFKRVKSYLTCLSHLKHFEEQANISIEGKKNKGQSTQK